MPPPVPPSVKAGRTMAGRPIVSSACLGRALAFVRRRALDDEARGVGLVDPVEQVAERLAVLGHVDRLERRAEQADRVALEDAGPGHGRGEVQRRLAAQAGEQALRLLLRDDRLDDLDGERLEVDRVGDRGVGHDRGRVRVDEDRADALGPQRAAGLRPGVVELGGLPDDDGPAAEDQDRRGLGAGLGHATLASRGGHEPVEHGERVERPGRALGVVLDGLDRQLAWRRPSTEPVVEVDLADAEAGRRRAATRRRPGPRGSGRSPGRARGRRPGPGGSPRGARTGAGVVSAPAARPTIWWPRQIPSSGRPSSMIARARATWTSSRAGSPGPGERITPSMSRREDVDRARDRVRAGRGRGRRDGASLGRCST